MSQDFIERTVYWTNDFYCKDPGFCILPIPYKTQAEKTPCLATVVLAQHQMKGNFFTIIV